VSFHFSWAVAIMEALNRRLPTRFLAENQIHLGRQVAADVIEYEQTRNDDELLQNGTGYSTHEGGVATAAEPVIFAPPEVTATFEIEYDDAFEVKICDLERGQRIVAVIELVSPSNKDRPEERETFGLKVLSYLKSGIGVMIVDIVTDKHFNLHNEVIRVGRTDSKFNMSDSSAIYAAAYRPVRRKEQNLVDAWTRELSLGVALPVLPLALKGFGCISLDLEATYAEACLKSRIP